ncbi:MAG TPA: phosphatidylserine decarboxylase [Thermoplasmata archaeon]|nr:phosphatidylserine decarboxylase [Thermoplasmata archaeon]
MFAPGSGRYLLLSGAGLVLLAGGFIAGWVDRTVLAGALLVLGWGVWGFFAVFFRDPERTIGPGIVAAADGRVRAVEVEGGWTTISTFMNVHNVHVNRFPLEATVRSIDTRGSGFRAAYRDDARHNRRRHYLLDTALGEVEVVQMTGVVARRLISLVQPGEIREKGSRLGMILLGSRVDVRLPAHRVRVLVRVGDRVAAGTTPIAEAVG